MTNLKAGRRDHLVGTTGRFRRRARYYLASMAGRPSTQLWIAGAQIHTCPGVFDPSRSTSTVQICEWVRARSPVESLLDLGTGTGAIGVVAALRGCQRVVMTDCNPLAVACARRNVEINGVSEVCTVRQAQGTEDVYGSFELVVFAAPYLWFDASRAIRDRFGPLVDSMFDDEDSSKLELIREARRLLTTKGRLALQVGSFSRVDNLIREARSRNLTLVSVERAPDGAEEHLILEFAVE